MADGPARGRPPLAPGAPAGSSSVASTSSASTVSTAVAASGTDVGARDDRKARDKRRFAGSGAGSTSLNASHGVAPPFEPNADISTPLQRPQYPRAMSQQQQQYQRHTGAGRQWQPDFNSVGSLRRPSESSDDSELHSHNLATGLRQNGQRPQPQHHPSHSRYGDSSSGVGGDARYGDIGGGGGVPRPASAAPMPGPFNGKAVFEDIALPTVDSILSNAGHHFRGHVGRREHGGDLVDSGGGNDEWQPPVSLVYSGQHHSAPPQNQTTSRNAYQPSFADFNLAQQQQSISRAAQNVLFSGGGGTSSGFGVGGVGGEGAATASTVAGMPAGVLNSIAASPSLVSALHALQKRCRRLEEENYVLRENVNKEATAHAGFRSRASQLEETLSATRQELAAAHDETEVVRKGGMVLRKEAGILADKLDAAEAEGRGLAKRVAALEEEVEDLRRPAVVHAAVQTDNRREEELVGLMRRFDPCVLREAFEAELALERERSAWLEQQLNQTRHTLRSLAENVNRSNADESVAISVTRQPRFMWSTKSAKGRTTTAARGRGRSSGSDGIGGGGVKARRARARRGVRAAGKGGGDNIHRSLVAANNGFSVPFVPSGATGVPSHSVWANVQRSVSDSRGYGNPGQDENTGTTAADAAAQTHAEQAPSATATSTQDSRQWWQQLAAIGTAIQGGGGNGGGGGGSGGSRAVAHALAPASQVLDVAAVDDGKISDVIRGLEREIQGQVDAKMRLTSDSNVYEQLSEDIRSKSAILAALKATLRPASSMGERPHTSPGRQKLAFAKREAALNLFRTMRKLAGT